MYNFVLIRTYRKEDEPFCKKLLKAGVMDQLNATFIGYLLRKPVFISMNIVILLISIISLLKGFSVVYCLMFIFILPIFLYICLYVSFFNEAKDMEKEVSAISRIYMSDNSSHFWVAESYEFYLLNRHQRHEQRTFMTEEEFNKSNIDVSRHKKKVVDYRRKRIGTHLVNRALQFGTEQGFITVNVVISEYRLAALKLFYNRGFHRYLIRGRSYNASVVFHELSYRTKYFKPNELYVKSPYKVKSVRN
ncbi:probable N-acetyltransferase CML6 isoform X2 [Vespa mandarinia]|uniref:probable N-acetyltransferase CML6 isoform X2 n=1 Tax=Vespa mandarinia TaxID=7446 RepID=UPI0016139CF6|nr:probable N-acetyltransferase CML6 isoform X2 [Vespa mandarinia]